MRDNLQINAESQEVMRILQSPQCRDLDCAQKAWVHRRLTGSSLNTHEDPYEQLERELRRLLHGTELGSYEY